MEKELILIGGGGHCRSVIEAVESSGRKIRGILDLPELIGTEVSGYPVIGSDDDISGFVDDCEFIVTIGSIENSVPRQKLHRRVKDAGGTLATVVASTAFLSPRASIGAGTVLLHQSVVNSAAKVGESVIVNTGAIIEHDASVGDLTHVSTGAKVNGACSVGARCFVGSGAVMVQGTSICDDVFLGAGSLLAKDAVLSGTYVGFPARKLK
ncbi:acetyltransferase [Sangeribacter muris]|jgi:sugar O-acyltransferase (sialic acid O-acetyltransferase NeuD family)|uniref:acetyltransferase n=1 Tax=Sangeribacter muris TaxID=2880703 RepID=UPI000E9DF61D|nr:acetyltransferase [Sangeribacter muris]MBJ2197434.1 acetyltransferase [Muribaculaceae bacterium]RXE68629.1 acetyltransferase [Muribaculaceae bacterium Isolate-001 (NCI)]HBY15761.1 acetyltransferase [Porphyromonadaceae bacterium]